MTSETSARRGRRPGPRIRSIKPELFASEKFGRLNDRARTLFFGLISWADDEGRFRAQLPAIGGHVFPYDDLSPAQIARAMKAIEANGTILLYEVDGVAYGAFRNWRKHQSVSKPVPSKHPPPPDPAVVAANRLTEREWNNWISSGGTPEEDGGNSGAGSPPLRACAVPVPVPDPDVDVGGETAGVARERAHEGPAGDVERVWAHYLDRVYGGRGKLPDLDDVRRRVITRALRLRPLADVLAAIDGLAASDFHMARGERRGRTPYRDISYALRARQGSGKSDGTAIDAMAEAGRAWAAAQQEHASNAGRFAGTEDYEEIA